MWVGVDVGVGEFVVLWLFGLLVGYVDSVVIFFLLFDILVVVWWFDIVLVVLV